MTLRASAEDPALVSQLIDSLPPLPACELQDSSDDQTLPRLIEALEKRHRIRQMMTEQLNRTGGGGGMHALEEEEEEIVFKLFR